MAKTVRIFIILGVVAGIIFAIYLFLNRGGGMEGKYYPMGDASSAQYYEFNGKEVTMKPFGYVYSYEIKGDRLLLSAAGQSLECTLNEDKSEFELMTLKYIKVEDE